MRPLSIRTLDATKRPTRSSQLAWTALSSSKKPQPSTFHLLRGNRHWKDRESHRWAFEIHSRIVTRCRCYLLVWVQHPAHMQKSSHQITKVRCRWSRRQPSSNNSRILPIRGSQWKQIITAGHLYITWRLAWLGWPLNRNVQIRHRRPSMNSYLIETSCSSKRSIIMMVISLMKKWW